MMLMIFVPCLVARFFAFSAAASAYVPAASHDSFAGPRDYDAISGILRFFHVLLLSLYFIYWSPSER